jgi:hypothetical protein
VGSSSPAIMRSAVLLPLPDGPTRTTNSPSAMSTLSPETAAGPPPVNCLVTSTSLTVAMVINERAASAAW